MSQQTVNEGFQINLNDANINSNGTFSLDWNSLLVSLTSPSFVQKSCNKVSDCQKLSSNCTYANTYYQGRTVYSLNGLCLNYTIQQTLFNYTGLYFDTLPQNATITGLQNYWMNLINPNQVSLSVNSNGIQDGQQNCTSTSQCIQGACCGLPFFNSTSQYKVCSVPGSGILKSFLDYGWTFQCQIESINNSSSNSSGLQLTQQCNTTNQCLIGLCCSKVQSLQSYYCVYPDFQLLQYYNYSYQCIPTQFSQNLGNQSQYGIDQIDFNKNRDGTFSFNFKKSTFQSYLKINNYTYQFCNSSRGCSSGQCCMYASTNMNQQTVYSSQGLCVGSQDSQIFASNSVNFDCIPYAAQQIQNLPVFFNNKLNPFNITLSTNKNGYSELSPCLYANDCQFGACCAFISNNQNLIGKSCMIPGSYYATNYYFYLGLTITCVEPQQSQLNQSLNGLSLQQNCQGTSDCLAGLCCAYNNDYSTSSGTCWYPEWLNQYQFQTQNAICMDSPYQMSNYAVQIQYDWTQFNLSANLSGISTRSKSIQCLVQNDCIQGYGCILQTYYNQLIGKMCNPIDSTIIPYQSMQGYEIILSVGNNISSQNSSGLSLYSKCQSTNQCITGSCCSQCNNCQNQCLDPDLFPLILQYQAQNRTCIQGQSSNNIQQNASLLNDQYAKSPFQYFIDYYTILSQNQSGAPELNQCMMSSECIQGGCCAFFSSNGILQNKQCIIPGSSNFISFSKSYNIQCQDPDFSISSSNFTGLSANQPCSNTNQCSLGLCCAHIANGRMNFYSCWYPEWLKMFTNELYFAQCVYSLNYSTSYQNIQTSQKVSQIANNNEQSSQGSNKSQNLNGLSELSACILTSDCYKGLQCGLITVQGIYQNKSCIAQGSDSYNSLQSQGYQIKLSFQNKNASNNQSGLVQYSACSLTNECQAGTCCAYFTLGQNYYSRCLDPDSFSYYQEGFIDIKCVFYQQQISVYQETSISSQNIKVSQNYTGLSELSSCMVANQCQQGACCAFLIQNQTTSGKMCFNPGSQLFLRYHKLNYQIYCQEPNFKIASQNTDGLIIKSNCQNTNQCQFGLCCAQVNTSYWGKNKVLNESQYQCVFSEYQYISDYLLISYKAQCIQQKRFLIDQKQKKTAEITTNIGLSEGNTCILNEQCTADACCALIFYNKIYQKKLCLTNGSLAYQQYTTFGYSSRCMGNRHQYTSKSGDSATPQYYSCSKTKDCQTGLCCAQSFQGYDSDSQWTYFCEDPDQFRIYQNTTYCKINNGTTAQFKQNVYVNFTQGPYNYSLSTNYSGLDENDNCQLTNDCYFGSFCANISPYYVNYTQYKYCLVPGSLKYNYYLYYGYSIKQQNQLNKFASTNNSGSQPSFYFDACQKTSQCAKGLCCSIDYYTLYNQSVYYYNCKDPDIFQLLNYQSNGSFVYYCIDNNTFIQNQSSIQSTISNQFNSCISTNYSGLGEGYDCFVNNQCYYGLFCSINKYGDYFNSKTCYNPTSYSSYQYYYQGTTQQCQNQSSLISNNTNGLQQKQSCSSTDQCSLGLCCTLMIQKSQMIYEQRCYDPDAYSKLYSLNYTSAYCINNLTQTQYQNLINKKSNSGNNSFNLILSSNQTGLKEQSQCITTDECITGLVCSLYYDNSEKKGCVIPGQLIDLSSQYYGVMLQSYNQSYFKSTNNSGLSIYNQCSSSNQCLKGLCCSNKGCFDPDLLVLYQYYYNDDYNCIDKQSILFKKQYQQYLSTNQTGIKETYQCTSSSQCIQGSCCMINAYNGIVYNKWCIIPGSFYYNQSISQGFQQLCSVGGQFTSNNSNGLSNAQKCTNTNQCQAGTCCALLINKNNNINEQRCLDPDTFQSFYQFNYTLLQCINNMTQSQYNQLTSNQQNFKVNNQKYNLSTNQSGLQELSICITTDQCTSGSVCSYYTDAYISNQQFVKACIYPGQLFDIITSFQGYPLQPYVQNYFKSNNITGQQNASCSSTNQCIRGQCCTSGVNYGNNYYCSDPDSFSYYNNYGQNYYCFDNQTILISQVYQQYLSKNLSGTNEQYSCTVSNQCIFGSCCMISSLNNVFYQKTCMVPGSSYFNAYQKQGFSNICSIQSYLTSNNSNGLSYAQKCTNTNQCQAGTCCAILINKNNNINEQRCLDPDTFSQFYQFNYTLLQCINNMTQSQYNQLTSNNQNLQVSNLKYDLSTNQSGLQELSGCITTDQCISGSVCSYYTDTFISNQQFFKACIYPYQLFDFISSYQGYRLQPSVQSYFKSNNYTGQYNAQCSNTNQCLRGLCCTSDISFGNNYYCTDPDSFSYYNNQGFNYFCFDNQTMLISQVYQQYLSLNQSGIIEQNSCSISNQCIQGSCCMINSLNNIVYNKTCTIPGSSYFYSYYGQGFSNLCSIQNNQSSLNYSGLNQTQKCTNNNQCQIGTCCTLLMYQNQKNYEQRCIDPDTFTNFYQINYTTVQCINNMTQNQFNQLTNNQQNSYVNRLNYSLSVNKSGLQEESLCITTDQCIVGSICSYYYDFIQGTLIKGCVYPGQIFDITSNILGQPLVPFTQTYFKSSNNTGLDVFFQCNNTNQCRKGTCCTLFYIDDSNNYQQCSDPDLFEQSNSQIVQNGYSQYSNYQQYCVDNQTMLYIQNNQQYISTNQKGLQELQTCVINNQCIQGSCCAIVSQYYNQNKYCLIPGSSNFNWYQKSGYQIQCSNQSNMISYNVTGLNSTLNCQNTNDCSIGTCCTLMQNVNSNITEQRCIDPDLYAQFYQYGYTTLKCINNMTNDQYANYTKYSKNQIANFNVSLSFNNFGLPESQSCIYTDQCVQGSCCSNNNYCIVPYQLFYYQFQQQSYIQCQDSIYSTQLQEIIIPKQYRYCYTFDNINCYIKPFYKYVSYDGSYCITQNGKQCAYTYGGSSCDQLSGAFCVTYDGKNMMLALDCLTFDGKNCHYDEGNYCNQSNGLNVCNKSMQLISFCQSIDGQICYDFSQGWYFTYDGALVSAVDFYSSNYGSYCFSNDYQYSCYQSYGLQCNQSTGQNCFNQLVSYCITQDNISCFTDQGLLCNSISNQCNLNITQIQSCATYEGIYCQNFSTHGWYLSIDGQDVYNLDYFSSGTQAIYCISYDGVYCHQDYGDYCDVQSGTFCAKDISGINYEYVAYCATLDNLTCCISQYTQSSNNSPNQQYCNVQFNQLEFSVCNTVDGVSCYDIYQGFCFTTDGFNCILEEYTDEKGSYCWSNNGFTCSSYGLYYCNYLDGPNCNKKNNFSQPYSYCITADNKTCIKDIGQYCNNSYNIMSCNINNQLAQTCLTTDTLTCSLAKYNSTVDINLQLERQALRDYFYYATVGKVSNDLTQVGVCDPDCLYYQDTCCVAIRTRDQNGQQVIFDNICMNINIAKTQMNIQISGSNYNLRCSQPNKNKLTQAYIGISKFYGLILATLIILISI